jgi:glycosyltransferase involved in cell wall biosynthesis
MDKIISQSMKQVKISVIIPVFNVELYLRQCLDSVINQSLQEIEILCINDGSTDHSLSILKEYATKDDRIRVIDKENEGQGVARNIAIKQATGEYLGFVDSDDWIEANMFQALYTSAKTFDSDVTLCEYQHFDQDTGIISQADWHKLPIDVKFDGKTFCWEEINEVGFLINSGPWNKIYRKDFVTKNNIEFAPGLHYQDVLFVFKSLVFAKNISLVRTPFYIYRYSRPGSTSSDKGKKQFDIFGVLNLLEVTLEDSKKFELLKVKFNEYKFDQYLFHFSKVNIKYRKKFWGRIKSEFKKLDEDLKESLFSYNDRLKIGITKGMFFYANYQNIKETRFLINQVLFSHNIKGRLRAIFSNLLRFNN